MQLGEQDRFQRILEELEGAYREESILPGLGQSKTGQGLPQGTTIEKKKTVVSPAADARMQRLLLELETAYPSNYQMLQPEAIPTPEKTPGAVGGILKGAGQTVHTIGAGGYQGLAGWTDLLDRLSEQGLTKEYQKQYGYIVKAPVPGSETMTPQQIQAAKMAMFEKLGPLDQWLKNNKPKFIARATDALTKQGQAHAAAGIPMTENKVMEVIRQVTQGLGQAGVDVPVYMMGGPVALPAVGAARGLAEKGTAAGAVLGGVEGAMLQTMIHAIGLLPSGFQLPTWFGMGAAISSGGVQDRVVGGLTWAGLGVSGVRGKEKVTVREFIERYPRWQKRVDDNSAMKVLQTLAPEVTPEVMAQYGGPKAMLDKFIGLKDKFTSVMELYRKSNKDPAALQAALNKPEMVPLFKELMGLTGERGPALPPARPETIQAGTPARFQVTETGHVVGTQFPEALLLRISYREQELGRRMTPEELTEFFKTQKFAKKLGPPKTPQAAPAAVPPPTPAAPAPPSAAAPVPPVPLAAPAAPMGPAELAKWEVKKLGTATPAFRDETSGTVYPGQPGEQTHPQMLVRLEDQGVSLDNLTAGWIKDSGEFATSAEVQAQRTPPPAVVPKAKALPKHVFGAVKGGGRGPKFDFSERMAALKERAAQQRAMGIPESKPARRPMGKKEEMEKRADAYAAEEAELQNKIARIKSDAPLEFDLPDVADFLLRSTGYDAESIKDFKENVFMDAEEAKAIATEYAKGSITFEDAADALKEMVRDVVEPSAAPPPTEVPAEIPGEFQPREANLSDQQIRMGAERDFPPLAGDKLSDWTKKEIEKEKSYIDQALRESSEAGAIEFEGIPVGEIAQDRLLIDRNPRAYFAKQIIMFDQQGRQAERAGQSQLNETYKKLRRQYQDTFDDIQKDYGEGEKVGDVYLLGEIEKPSEFRLSQEALTPPKKELEAAQPTLIELGKIERAYPPGFDNRGIGTWPDQESMRRDVNPLITQGWVAEYGQSPEGKTWVRLKERGAAGEGKLERGEVKLPEFGKPKPEEAQLAIDDELSASLPMKAEPLKTSEDLKVQKPGADEPTEPDEFEAWYKSQMEEYNKAIEAAPGGQVKAFKLYMKDPTGTERPIGNYPEESRAELEAYAKEKGVGDKIVFGETFNAKGETVNGPKELDIAKETMDWLDETRAEYEAPAKNKKAEEELLDDKGETELFAGLPVSKSIRERFMKIVEKLDVETLFNRLKGKDTGLATKLYHTRKNREFELAEGAVKAIKKIAKNSNGGKDLSPAEYQRIFVLASKPKTFAALPDAERARLGPIVRTVRSFFDNYVPRLRAAGVIEDPWPLSAIRRMKLEIQDYKERVDRMNLLPGTEQFQKKVAEFTEKIKERARAIGFLESTGMRYVHIPRYWLEAFFEAQPERAPRILSELFGKRETLDIEWLANKLLTDGHIKPGDLDVRRIMLMYAHKAGHKIALGEIIKAGKHDGLIVSAAEAPETWPRLPHQSFPSLRGYRMNPEMLEFLERNYLKPHWMPPTVGAIMGWAKMAQFWNPVNLSQYSLIQTAWTGAVTSLKAPKVFWKAGRDMVHKTPDYWEANYWGAFPDPFSPTFRQAEARAKKIIGEDPILKKVLTAANPYHWSLMLAWKMENYFKMASYNYLREKGFSPRESAQIAAKTGGDYATLPPATRKILNKVLFTPSFTIAMMKTQGEMAVAGAKIMAKPKLLFDKTGDAKYLRQMAKGAVFLTGGILLKNMMMHKLGYKTDVWGLKWSKTIEDEEGNERELVVHMAAPDNVIIRYLNDLRLVGKAENKAKVAFDRLTWKLHPMWVTALEVASNKRLDGTPVWNPWDSSFEGRKKALIYATRRIIRISELLPEQGQGSLSKVKATRALQHDLGLVGGFVMARFSIPYIRSTADRRFMYEMTQMLDVFKQANKAAPPKDEAEAEERATWLQESLEKIRKRIEEIRE